MKVKKLEKHCKCGAVIEFAKGDILKRHKYYINMDYGFLFDYWNDETYILCPICGKQIILTSERNKEKTKELRVKKKKEVKERKKTLFGWFTKWK